MSYVWSAPASDRVGIYRCYRSDGRRADHYLSILSDCEGGGTVENGGNPFFYVAKTTVTDMVRPVVSLTAPVSGATLSGTTTLSANASDPSTGSGQASGVAFVRFRVASTSVDLDTAPPYTTKWDTTSVPNGKYRISAIARDAAWNRATSTVVVVTVSNANPQLSCVLSADPATVGTGEASLLSWTTAKAVSILIDNGV